MPGFTRYAVYYLPPPGPLATFGAHWLGWDVQAGRAVAQPDVPGIGRITGQPRKYGFHATLKPPFRLAPGGDAAALGAALDALTGRMAPALCDGLQADRLGRFLALRPVGDVAAIAGVAAGIVEGIDHFRAPPDRDELARRRKARLTPAQDALLTRWGYPYVMEEFRFHMTLTGPLARDEADTVRAHLDARLPPLPAPFVLDQVALVGEQADGTFREISRFFLRG